MRIIEKPPNELKHYGVLGMRWGHRKRQDGPNVTKAKQEHANRKIELEKASSNYQKEYNSGRYPSKKTRTALNDARRELAYSTQDLKSAKILDRLNSKPKTKSQLSMEEKYKAKGMNDDEAAVAAYKNLKTKKILAVTGGLTLVAASGYAAYKVHDARVDKLIKADTLLQNISADDTTSVRDAFYSANNKLDRAKYKGLYGGFLMGSEGTAFKKEIKVLSDIKQASPKHAHEALSELMKKDPEFAKDFSRYLKGGNYLGAPYVFKHDRALSSLSEGKITKNVYEVFNASLVDHDSRMQPLTNKYFDYLASKGYNAIKDVNDSKYSGYKSINPIITFGSTGKVSVVDVAKLTKEQVNKNAALSYTTILGSDLVKKGAAITTSILSVNEISRVKKQNSDAKRAAAYRSEHPETTLSNTEITRMLEREMENDW